MTNDSACWWCCHSFPGPALHCPFRYDERTKRFTTSGAFCSWECMKTYAMDTCGARAGEIQMYIALMRKHANAGKYAPVRHAPKRPSLKFFGGTLTIEEFRSGSSNVVVTMPWETHIMPTIASSRGIVHSHHVTTAPVQDDLVLKRAKPLARAKSSLEASLGITRRSK